MLKLCFVVLFIYPLALFSQVEICDNAQDDDGDGLIDLNDDDCACEIIELTSLIPNASFEDTQCCPSSRSQLDCAVDWIQASDPTTDYLHTCGWLGWENLPPPTPFPDGEGIVGFRDGRAFDGDVEPNWKEYAGACLTSPLGKDTTYRIEFEVGFVDGRHSPPIEITFFGTTSCDYLPFGVGNVEFGCPTNSPDWKRLAQVFVNGGAGNRWVKASLEITPTEDIRAIAIGPSCRATTSPVSLYYFFDNLVLANIADFDFAITGDTHPCDEAYRLSIPEDRRFNYLWYKDGIALVGEDSHRLSQDYGEGRYEVRLDDGTNCRLSKPFNRAIPVTIHPQDESICFGTSYNFGETVLSEGGMYIDTFKNVFNCDSIVLLDLEVRTEILDTLAVSIFSGSSFDIDRFSFDEAGTYDVLLATEQGCDSLINISLTKYPIYIPNVFSPDGDGINDMFHPIGPDAEEFSYEMEVYDSWGNLIYSGNAWDGRDTDPGVYVYRINFDFDLGSSSTVSGNISILR